jgi:alpha-glucosidase
MNFLWFLLRGQPPVNVDPWLPVAPDYQQVNVVVERKEATSMLTLTRALLIMRRSRPALNRGSYRGLESGSQDCFVYLRQFDNQCLLVALNFSEEPQLVKIPELIEGQLLLSTSLNREGPINLTALMLDGHEGCIIELPDDE